MKQINEKIFDYVHSQLNNYEAGKVLVLENGIVLSIYKANKDNVVFTLDMYDAHTNSSLDLSVFDLNEKEIADEIILRYRDWYIDDLNRHTVLQDDRHLNTELPNGKYIDISFHIARWTNISDKDREWKKAKELCPYMWHPSEKNIPTFEYFDFHCK